MTSHLIRACQLSKPNNLRTFASSPQTSLAASAFTESVLELIKGDPQGCRGRRTASAGSQNISIEGKIIRDGVRKTLAQRKSVIEELVRAIKQYRQSQDHQSVHALNKALERAEEHLTPDH